MIQSALSSIQLKIKHKFTDPVFVYQYYQVIRYVVSLLISIVMVRSALPAIELGQYEMLIFIVASMSTFWSAGVKNAMISWFGSQSSEAKDQLPTQVFWLLNFGSLLGMIFLLSFPETISNFFSNQVDLTLMPYAAIWIGVSMPIILIENIFYLNNKTKLLLQYTHWSMAGWLVLTIVIALVSPSIINFLWMLISWGLVRWLYLVMFVIKGPIFQFHGEKIWLFFLFSIPLIFQMLLGSAMDFIDGWFVARNFDAAYFPVFKYGARELPFSSLLYSSLSIAMIPIIMKQGLESNAIKKKATTLMHYLVPVSIILMFLSPFLFPLFYTSAYLDAAFIFNTYLLIIISRVLLPQSFNLALHQHKIIVWASILEIIFNVILSYWWLQDFGVFGLAMATVVSYLIQKIILIVYNYRVNGLSISNYIDVRYYVLYCVLMIVAYFFTFNIFK